MNQDDLHVIKSPARIPVKAFSDSIKHIIDKTLDGVLLISKITCRCETDLCNGIEEDPVALAEMKILASEMLKQVMFGPILEEIEELKKMEYQITYKTFVRINAILEKWS